jgi:Xaa-Pro dipeptidase
MDALLAAKIDRVFLPHGLGHHLGLDVHDEGEEGPIPGQLKEGHVVTCEPGCYFMPLLLGQAMADKDKVGVKTKRHLGEKTHLSA